MPAPIIRKNHIYAVWNTWKSWETWICKEPFLGYWWQSSAFPSKHCYKNFCWSPSEAFWRRSQDLASQVRVRDHVVIMSILNSAPHLSLNKTTTCSFEFRLRVALAPGGDLILTSRIRNTNIDGRPFSFTFAYHTCFSVSDIRYA